MDVAEAIERRRAYRALTDAPISDEVVHELARAAQLSPSAMNRQPCRLVFVRDRRLIQRLHDLALPDYNAWAAAASMVIAVCGSEASDPPANETIDIRPYVEHPMQFDRSADKNLPPRQLFLLDLGIATGFIILRATELDLVAHPIAGYLEADVRALLGVPTEIAVAALLVVGRRTKDPAVIDALPKEARPDEHARPARLPIDKIAFNDRYPAP